MSFSPVIPISGIGGWNFLNRTMVAQKAAFKAAPTAQRDEEYFRTKISSVISAEQLVGDRRLLKVALGAFGLESDINNKYFIRKVLDDGTLSDDALSSKLADKSYAKLSAAFGFGDYATPRTQLSDFADSILTSYAERQFETAVGEQNPDLRLALNARREVAALARSGSSDRAQWFSVLGSEPLRQVFETAFGLPSAFAAIDIDQQVTVLQQKAKAAFGESTLAQFGDADRLEALLRRFLVRSTDEGSPTTPASAALQILRGENESASAGLLSILL